jgi:hypothetical protein
MQRVALDDREQFIIGRSADAGESRERHIEEPASRKVSFQNNLLRNIDMVIQF